MNKYGWYSSLVFISNGRIDRLEEIENMSCHKVLTYLSYKLDEIANENEEIKKRK